MNSLKMAWGALHYEFLMQVRRPTLWLTFLGFALLLLNRSLIGGMIALHAPTLQLAALLALLTNWLAPLGVGIFLADRLPRDRRLKVEELLNTLSGTIRMRMLSKYLGATLATLLPAFLLYLLILGFAVWQTGNFLLIPPGIVCYAVIVLPGMFFVSAFSIACPAVIWGPLYQFLFFGYWFWGNLLSPTSGLPTLNGTALTPIGTVIDISFFGISSMRGVAGPSSPLNGVASIVALLGLAILALVALFKFLKWQQARQ
ncbi:hypothetical protein EPA93_44825 [Ktedonosporobacter rubrisoli]|uniref:ABC transporter permease n=1 Tax=Ktedonosporobacter rubrisoli TaxID=2509675 RepID=A0A4P6K394_KTERU|nr:hypothetical protein [Ktedonosporobacter rubrisoli]QBD82717.1 hypothetical protein EPA93_44825 [Ktedonosporobacter rubrisoli]